MAAKAKTSKKTASKNSSAKNKSPRAKAPAAKAGSAKATPVFYFVIEDSEPRILETRPKSTGATAHFNGFDEVKDFAIDHLIELIDNCERRLYQIKRAENFQHYRQLTAR